MMTLNHIQECRQLDIYNIINYLICIYSKRPSYVTLFQDLIVLMVGGVFIALAIEKCELHRRIAIGILMRVGTKPRW